ncbi:MAG: glycosyltransferase family 1 protein [Thiolinea sp.]
MDLHYARFILQEAPKREVYFIRQRQNVSYILPFKEAATLITNLDKRWLQGIKFAQKALSTKYDYLSHWPSKHLRQQTERLVDPRLHKCLANSIQSPIYIHSGHGTLHHLDLHIQIKQQLAADMVYYLHDLIPIEFPEYTNNPNAVAMHQRRLQTMATTGSLILANSEDSRKKFLDYCSNHRLPQPNTDVLLIGVEQTFINAANAPQQALPVRFTSLVNSVYFITIGTIEARKNHLSLLHLWRQLAEELGDQCPKLVIVGKRGWKADHIFHLLDSSPALKKTVIEVQDANDQEMLSLTQHACALLFPSFAEGWGMPLAEALTLKTPAICSDLPALRECGRNHCIYLNPIDSLSWKMAILSALNNEIPRKNTYLPDTWDRHLHKLNTHLLSLETGN